MILSHIWNVYSEGDYDSSFRHSVNTLAEASGIDLLHIAGLSLMNLRRYDEGLALLKAAITFRPETSHMYSNAAYIAECCGMKYQAEYFADMGLRDFPDDPDLLLLKANSFIMQMRFDDAEAQYLRLLDRDPQHIQSMVNLGNIARSRDDIAQAKQWFARAEALEADFRDLIFARATMHTQLGEDEAAIELLEPIGHDVDAQFLLSLLYLSHGDYERGFRLYRSRANAIWYKGGNFVHPLNPFDHWSEAEGKRIAVIHEGGNGDMMQFCRYFPMLAEIAADITVFTPPHVARLLSYNMPNLTVLSSYENFTVESFDYVTTEVEMAYHFRTSLESIPDKIPYLSVPDEMIEEHRLPATDLLRVGLCWAGGKQDELNQRNYDVRRSFDLATYAPLATIPGIEFVSLQFGPPAEETCEALPMLRVLDSSFDFLDTAAIIMQLDLVISVDTAVVHLAAALGKPTWLLSRYDGCWRWIKNCPESPWYPDVLRVFGQKQYRDWSAPIAEVTEALRNLSA